MKRNNEKRECLHAHNKLNYTISFCSNIDFLSKNTFFFFSNYKMLMNYFLLKNNIFFFYLVTYLILSIKYLTNLNIKYLKKYLKLIVRFIFYTIFIILIKIFFFINLFLNKLNVEYFKISLIKNDTLKFSINILSTYKHPVILLELFFRFLKDKNFDTLKNLEKISKNSYFFYNGYKKFFIEKKIELNNEIYLFYKILLQILGKNINELNSKKNLEKFINCFRNKMTKNLFEFYNQIILNYEIEKTLNFNYI